MEEQIAELVKNLNGRKPNRVDVMALLDLVYDEPQPDKDQYITLYAQATDPKILEDIKSYPNYEKPQGVPTE